jgi:hypothetical protein
LGKGRLKLNPELSLPKGPSYKACEYCGCFSEGGKYHEQQCNAPIALPKGDEELKSAEDLAIEFGEEMLSNLRVNVAADKERRSKLPKPEDEVTLPALDMETNLGMELEFPGMATLPYRVVYNGNSLMSICSDTDLVVVSLPPEIPEGRHTYFQPTEPESRSLQFMVYASNRHHTLTGILKERERQLLSALRKLSTTERELDEVIEKNRKFNELNEKMEGIVDMACDAGEKAERELQEMRAVHGECLPHRVQIEILERMRKAEDELFTLKAGETASDAWERGYRAAQKLAYISPWDEHISGNPIASILGSPAQCVDVHRGLILAQTVPPYTSPLKGCI